MFSLSIPYFYLIHIVIISIRVGAALLFAPIWGYYGLPQYLRILLVLSIAAGVASVVPIDAAAYSNPGLVIPTELLIGTLVSMGIRIAFAGLHMGGGLVSYHLGFSAVQAIDPQTMNRSTLMAAFFTMMGYMILLATDQHHNIFRALATSYAAFPVGASVVPGQWFDTLFEVSKEIFIIGWKIALPVFLATFVVEVTVGFIARMQPQINTMVVTAPLKLLIGLIVLGASLVYMPHAMSGVLDAVVLRSR